MANRKRNKHIDLRLTESEFNQLTSRITKSKLSKQEYLLRCALEKDITVIENGVEIVRELIRIGTNLNQLTKIANSTKSIDTKPLEDLREEVEKIWQQLNLRV